MFQREVISDYYPLPRSLRLDMLYRHIDLFPPSLQNSGSAFTLGRTCSTLSVDLQQRSGLDKQSHRPKMHLKHAFYYGCFASLNTAQAILILYIFVMLSL